MPGEASGDARLARIMPGRNARFAGMKNLISRRLEDQNQKMVYYPQLI